MYRTIIDNTQVNFDEAFAEKYNRPGPRYTSYPTAPQWNDRITSEEYETLLMDSNASGRNLSLYMHIPFCEEQCTFCGCSTVITKKKEIADPYVAALEQELYLLDHHLDSQRQVTQLHWGGGTPTYLTCAQIEQLWETISKYFRFSDDAEISIEVDPRVTSREQLALLRECGFNRISLGIQDFDSKVQAAVNRIQPMEMSRTLIEAARELGFVSINVDLIYGLPHQTPEGFAKTVEQTIALNPDRVACFSFAFVPWLKAAQRKIDTHALPPAASKLGAWCRTIEQFHHADYAMIGFDHFAKRDDELTLALNERSLRRNFQGYSTQAGTDLLACGMTGIGDVNGCYIQNEKKLTRYQEQVHANEFPVVRGCRLSSDDHIRRSVIHELLCNNFVDFAHIDAQYQIASQEYFAPGLAALTPLIKDGLAERAGNTLSITPRGRLFARNVAMCFDRYLAEEMPSDQRYSQTV